jgi:hypothetical protein
MPLKREEVTFGDIAAFSRDKRLWGMLGRSLPPRLFEERERRIRVAINKLIKEGYITPTTKTGLNYLTQKGKRERNAAWDATSGAFFPPSLTSPSLMSLVRYSG